MTVKPHYRLHGKTVVGGKYYKIENQTLYINFTDNSTTFIVGIAVLIVIPVAILINTCVLVVLQK